MPIICPVETRSRWVRMVFIAMYTVLTLGAATMIYPLAMMISGSLKSEVDTVDMDPIPRYFFSEKVLFQKFLESKYSGQMMFFQQVYQNDIRSWRQIVMPRGSGDVRLVKLFEEFRKQNSRPDWQVLGHSYGSSGIVFQNTRKFRTFLEGRFEGSIQKANEKFGTVYNSFLSINPPSETEMVSRRNQSAKNAYQDLFDEFKMSRPADERIFVDLDGYYRLYYIQPMYHTVENYNKTHHTNFKDLSEILLEDRPPGKPSMRKDWEYFVRNELNPIFIKLAPGPKKEQISDLNLFIQTRAAPDDISVYGPRQAFEKFMTKSHVPFSKEAFSQAVREADFWEFQTHKKEFFYDCLKRNYLTVLDYILLHGNGVANTFIYCLLAVVSQLLVNPLAAYALSRYKPPSTYKILLFCMATMAFPSAVTMIPAFLLLRNLNLLNTFAALILPSMANGYWIFLLKGFFDSLPRELYEAADLDGASEWRKFWTITMSLSKPILAVIALGAFTAAYSNFMFALIIIPDQKMWTLMVWIYQLQMQSPQAITYAALCLAAVPTLLVFLFAQNLIMRGIVVPVEK
jgi:ABC-type glycerol-3-phosphate transport system permease component